MPLMDRIKTVDFLSIPEPTQLELVLSIQAMRIEGLKNAKIPKVRKTKTGKNKSTKTRKSTAQSTEDKAMKALKKLSPAQFELIQKMLNEGK